ncbi:hypothetical protein [Georgenia muralis]
MVAPEPAPEAVAPEPAVPETIAPEPMAPEAVVPEPAPEPAVPETIAPEPMAPEAVVPEPAPVPAEPVAGKAPLTDTEPVLTTEPVPDPAGPASDAGPVGATDLGDPAAAGPSGSHEGHEGADLTVTKTLDALTPSYGWSLEKAVLPPDRQGAGPDHVATFAYEVTVSAVADADLWTMGGDITVTNPNAWDVVADVSDPTDLPGATCSVTRGTGATVPAESSLTLDYGCTLTGPTAGTNTAPASWMPRRTAPRPGPRPVPSRSPRTCGPRRPRTRP